MGTCFSVDWRGLCGVCWGSDWDAVNNCPGSYDGCDELVNGGLHVEIVAIAN